MELLIFLKNLSIIYLNIDNTYQQIHFLNMEYILNEYGSLIEKV